MKSIMLSLSIASLSIIDLYAQENSQLQTIQELRAFVQKQEQELQIKSVRKNSITCRKLKK